MKHPYKTSGPGQNIELVGKTVIIIRYIEQLITIMTPDQYCQNKTAKSGSSFYYSFLFLPPEQRKAITALYAFCREVDDIVDECTDTTIAAAKLQWWRETMENTFQGQPEHPVQHALAHTIKHFNLPLKYFLEIIEGMAMDLSIHRYPSFNELSLYCYRAAGVVGLMAAEIFGYDDQDALKYAHNLGLAFQLTNILRDVREDAERDRIYIPQDELERFGVTEQDILSFKDTEALHELLKFQAQRAHQYYEKAYSYLAEKDRYNQRSGLIMAAIYREVLYTIEKENYSVMRGRISVSPFKKLWLAWKTARSEKQRHTKLLTCN